MQLVLALLVFTLAGCTTTSYKQFGRITTEDDRYDEGDTIVITGVVSQYYFGSLIVTGEKTLRSVSSRMGGCNHLSTRPLPDSCEHTKAVSYQFTNKAPDIGIGLKTGNTVTAKVNVKQIGVSNGFVDKVEFIEWEEEFANRKAEQKERLAAQNKEADEKEARYLKSADYVKDLACEDLQILKSNQAIIKHQNEVGRVSGTVDKVVLYKAGQKVVNAKAAIAASKTEYKKRSGKVLDLTGCSAAH